MKHIKIVSLLVIFAGSINIAHAAESCETRRASIQNEITYAQQHGNRDRIYGLQKALDELNAHCTTASVRADTRKEVDELNDKIDRKLSDIKHEENELREAEIKGDTRKIQKHKRKIAEKQAEISEYREQLNEAQNQLQTLSY